MRKKKTRCFLRGVTGIESQQLFEAGFFAVRPMLKSLRLIQQQPRTREHQQREREGKEERERERKVSLLAIAIIVSLLCRCWRRCWSNRRKRSGGDAGNLTSHTDKPMLGFRLFTLRQCKRKYAAKLHHPLHQFTGDVPVFQLKFSK